MSSLMHAVVLTGFGGPEKLIYTQVPHPIPKAGEVLIQVGASSVNNTDLNTRTGWYGAESQFQGLLQDTSVNDVNKSASWQQRPSDFTFPRVQGADIVGQVAELGADVDARLLHQRVMVDSWIRGETFDQYQYVGSELDGGFAEYVALPASNVYPIESSLSDAELASFPCSYSTAENMLTKGRVSDTDTVLIMGASGGVGSALIQLSNIRGATTIAVVGADKESGARQLGADYVYRRDKQLAAHLATYNITVVLDVVGGDYFDLVCKVLQPGGRYVMAGAIAGPMVTFDLRDLIYKDLQMIGATRIEPDVFQRLVRYIEQALLQPLEGV
ncbi:zinc-binding alcohol dehydrogenase [Candidatus Entotheonella serta]|nr:zinc-binding alcohol dehydrogenase [Candidatus Entotheonella serta]